MERLNDEGQWIIMIGFVMCIIMLFLALIIGESILVGQTTAEGVLEFSKNDIQDMKNEISRIEEIGYSYNTMDSLKKDIELLSMERKNALVVLPLDDSGFPYFTSIHYENGVTRYDEILN